jgi:predicted DNA-binding transcriptional regulator AlpA
MAKNANSGDVDELVPDPQVWRELGITSMTGWRYTHDAELNFPPPIKIRTRNFRSRRQLESFKARLLSIAIASRDGRAA